MTTLDDLVGEGRWVAWRNEPRAANPEKVTKVPYSPRGGKAKADDPATWGTRGEAEAHAKRIVNERGGGVGFQFGPPIQMNHGLAIGGVDLDTCRTPDGSIELWASEIIERFTSYTEVSPSRTGVKVFFRYRVAGLPELRAAMAPAKHGREFKRGGGDHPPAIELHLSNRFFTVTGQRLDGTPESLSIVDKKTLLWLLHEAGPDFARNASEAKSRGKGADNSRSAIAFCKGLEMRRAGASFEQFCAALRADPATADWYTEKGIAADGRQLKRIWERAGTKGHAAQRTITVHAGERHQAADAGLAALQAAGTPFYQRGRTLVRVCEVKARSTSGEVIFVPGIAEVTPAILDRALGQAARWERFDLKRQEMVRIDPPRAVVAQILDMVGEWPFPVLAGVIGCPTLRPDGSLLNGEGYDETTGLVLRCSIPLPLLSDRPSRQAAEAAATLLLDLLAEFPFADETSKSVALSMLLTPVLRGAMTAAPMHLVTAPRSGTGKSYLADVAAMIATGERVAAVAVAPNPEETEKRLVGARSPVFPSSASTIAATRWRATSCVKSLNAHCCSSVPSGRATRSGLPIPSRPTRTATTSQSLMIWYGAPSVARSTPTSKTPSAGPSEATRSPPSAEIVEPVSPPP